MRPGWAVRHALARSRAQPPSRPEKRPPPGRSRLCRGSARREPDRIPREKRTPMQREPAWRAYVANCTTHEIVHNRHMSWESALVKLNYDLLAPDGSEGRVLVSLPRASMV